jgi:hypothetical protein
MKRTNTIRAKGPLSEQGGAMPCADVNGTCAAASAVVASGEVLPFSTNPAHRAHVKEMTMTNTVTDTAAVSLAAIAVGIAATEVPFAEMDDTALAVDMAMQTKAMADCLNSADNAVNGHGKGYPAIHP